MPQSAVRSSSKSRVREIGKALASAHDHAMEACGKTLHGMPEYYMCSRVAEHFTHEFANFRYRLEVPVTQVIRSLSIPGQDSLLKQKEIRPAGRFDVVLFTRKSGKAAHIIEFKKGDKLSSLRKDIDRIALLADNVSARSRLETNYLVFITKRNFDRTESAWQKRLDEIVEDSLIRRKNLKKTVTCKIKSVWKEKTSPSRLFEADRKAGKKAPPFSVVIVEIRTRS